jgi:hypothetical protein
MFYCDFKITSFSQLINSSIPKNSALGLHYIEVQILSHFLQKSIHSLCVLAGRAILIDLAISKRPFPKLLIPSLRIYLAHDFISFLNPGNNLMLSASSSSWDGRACVPTYAKSQAPYLLHPSPLTHLPSTGKAA